MHELNLNYPKRLVGMAAALMLMLGLLVGCGSDSSPPANEKSAEKFKVAVYTGALMSLPAYVGKDAGIFEKNGLDVQLVDISDGRNMTAAVASGSIDIELNAIDNNALARVGGQDIIAVAGNTVQPVFSIIAGKGLSTPRLGQGFPASVLDLKGKKLGVMATGGSVEQLARYVLTQAGLDPDKDVKLINVGLPATGVPALKSGQIDAYMAVEPAQSLTAIGGIGKMILDLRETPLPAELEAIDWPYNQWASISKTFKEKPGAMAKFQKSMKEVFTYMADPANLDAVKKIALARISDNAVLVDNLLKANLSSFGFELPQARIDRAFKYLVDSGLIKEPVKYEDYVADGARS